MKKIFVLLSGLLLLTCSFAAAEGFKTLTADELKKMMDAKKHVVIVDSRTEKEFALGHLPGAINIPPEKVAGIAAMLPKDKSAQVVFYCRGVS